MSKVTKFWIFSFVLVFLAGCKEPDNQEGANWPEKGHSSQPGIQLKSEEAIPEPEDELDTGSDAEPESETEPSGEEAETGDEETPDNMEEPQEEEN